jgi:hypothetical protein
MRPAVETTHNNITNTPKKRREFDGTWIQGSAHDTAQRIPCAVVKPVQEVVEALRRQVLCCTEVEIRVELVDDAFKLENSVQPD